ncbi:metallophosphoesterase [Microbacterium esteraromaticum]|uniref:metallophosphoesterase family protein n=1 Tax=Microbacterium esteraromaticum TaxID=57043 RepID=UPI001A8E5759|nr:metallophosphoesterase [Microbacterium esteraromaticum]MBN8423117.1 metallophosphoesterase [Microbacterium esteraromaticum]
MEILETASTFAFPDERVWVVGDVHGNAGWIQTLLPAMRRYDPSLRTILQLGDYGFDHTGAGTHAVDFWAKKAGIERVLVTLGNHEEWNHIAPAQDDRPGQAIRVSNVVWLLPRPFRFTIGGRQALSLGGASSVDKVFRTPGKDWFEDELITEEMENAAIAAGVADVLLTHESPVDVAPEVLAIIASNPDRYPPDALSISAAQRERVQRVSDAVHPALHLHGHMHTYGSIDLDNGRRVLSLDRDTRAGNAGILDLKTLTFELLPHDLRRR